MKPCTQREDLTAGKSKHKVSWLKCDEKNPSYFSFLIFLLLLHHHWVIDADIPCIHVFLLCSSETKTISPPYLESCGQRSQSFSHDAAEHKSSNHPIYTAKDDAAYHVTMFMARLNYCSIFFSSSLSLPQKTSLASDVNRKICHIFTFCISNPSSLWFFPPPASSSFSHVGEQKKISVLKSIRSKKKKKEDVTSLKKRP